MKGGKEEVVVVVVVVVVVEVVTESERGVMVLSWRRVGGRGEGDAGVSGCGSAVVVVKVMVLDKD